MFRGLDHEDNTQRVTLLSSCALRFKAQVSSLGQTYPVTRAIGASHTACKHELSRNPRAHSPSVLLIKNYMYRPQSLQHRSTPPSPVAGAGKPDKETTKTPLPVATKQPPAIAHRSLVARAAADTPE